MPGEHSPLRDAILKWIVSSLGSLGWPPLDQLSVEQRAMVESMADGWERIARACGMPPESFTAAERRIAW